MALVGRAAECAAVEQAVGAARDGLSAALVLRGEPGVGKTALLDFAAESAADLRVLRLVGIESERELGFAALHQLLLPLLDQIDDLPPPQRAALRSAFGLADGPVPDRLLIGLGALSLLAEGARVSPIVCLLDDAQWLDEESAGALAFVARRLYADRVAMLFAERDVPGPHATFEGVAHLDIGGLADEDAATVLQAAVGRRVDQVVVDRVVADTGGNPLALIELGAALTDAQLSGASVLPEPLPVGRELEARFLRDVRQLPEDAQLYLLLVAAERSRELAFVERAAELLGLTADAAAASERAGLITLGSPIRFRHPVIRSAVYHGASASDRRRVHAALGAVSDRDDDAHRRAWHRAAAAAGPDEEIAAELEATAGRAQRRGGDMAAAAFFTRAAEMSEDATSRTRRMVAAAAADLAAGAPGRALSKLDEIHPDGAATGTGIGIGDGGSALDAQVLRLRGVSRFALGETAEALPTLVAAARALAPYDAGTARETLLDALSAAVFNGRFASSGALADIAAEAARTAVPAGASPTCGDLLLDGLSTLYVAGHAEAAPRLRASLAALTAAADTGDLDPDDALRWLGFGALAAGSLGDYETVRVYATRLVGLARERGALVALTRGLYFLALADVVMGALGRAGDAFAEGQEIRAARGDPAGLGGVLVHAWRGEEAEARAEAAAVVHLTTERRQLGVLMYADYGLAVLELGRANYADALEYALRADREDTYFLSALALPDLIEAAVRTGDDDLATATLERLQARALVDGTPFALGMLARSRALLAGPDEEEDLYRESIALLEQSGSVGQHARSHLLFGEWLRRQRRRRDAREELRQAANLFENIGARAFAERARIELRATGERARRRTAETITELTPQESQISRLAASGATNHEIAGKLFISASTVDYHLRKVFRKLGIASRRELTAVLLPTDG